MHISGAGGGVLMAPIDWEETAAGFGSWTLQEWGGSSSSEHVDKFILSALDCGCAQLPEAPALVSLQ